jgi:hypothetical protein
MILSPGLSVRDALSNLTSVSLPPSLSISVSNKSRGPQDPQPLHDGHGCSSPHSSPTAAVRVSIPPRIGPPAQGGLNSPNQQTSRSVLGSLITFDPPRSRGPLYLPHGAVLVPTELTASGEIFHLDHVSSHLSQSHELLQRFYSTPEQPGTNSLVVGDIVGDSAISAQHRASTSVYPGHLDEPPSHLSVGRCKPLSKSYAKIPLFLPSQTPIRDPSQDVHSPQGSSLMDEGRILSRSPIRCTGQPRTDCPRSDLLHTSPLRHVELEVCLDVEGEWPDETTTDTCPRMLSAKSNHGLPHHQSANLPNDLGKKGSVIHDPIPTGECDIEPVETSVRAEI